MLDVRVSKTFTVGGLWRVELLMDVLHYGADAEIVGPPVLREQAKALLQLALSNYER